MGVHDGKINLPRSFQTDPDSRGLWLVQPLCCPVRRSFVFSEWFSLSYKCPTQGNMGLAFWVGIMHNFLL